MRRFVACAAKPRSWEGPRTLSGVSASLKNFAAKLLSLASSTTQLSFPRERVLPAPVAPVIGNRRRALPDEACEAVMVQKRFQHARAGAFAHPGLRSEERRVGKECRSR